MKTCCGQIFERFGDGAHFFVIYSVWVARKPPGYAFVEFDDKRDAVDAIKALDGIHYPLI